MAKLKMQDTWWGREVMRFAQTGKWSARAQRRVDVMPWMCEEVNRGERSASWRNPYSPEETHADRKCGCPVSELFAQELIELDPRLKQACFDDFPRIVDGRFDMSRREVLEVYRDLLRIRNEEYE